ncbi:major facilitator superfamily MFS_1 [Olsenella uli DSM 7084]|uniref:Major facilitator superfamily MFS_1 n=1 Tax=Olsenella uli (strain ATCC 49627 / DSM 7084 / CCUG 31166 / CIP 109912 / JCM 12494 / LMG 11480 / NCIMB 702895 / VPI D76D-27C) TaxID=633147 RepID=E1QVH5_OLSUV|nr:MFS transporter [Olsenella uli]ADK68128.1 major facilitator superfamily MFS_1 [Olsenella uli DSM 7084]KRO13075.1 major facilitator superfamily protein [Olsenella uli DSM 7084]
MGSSSQRAVASVTRGFHYAFAIVASCVAITCLPCALVLSCAGIFFTPVSAFFGVPKATFTLYFSIVNLAMMVTLPVWGKLLSRLDLRVALSAAVVATGVGCLGMSACQEMWQFYVCGAIMGIGVAPCIYLAVPTLINAWCVKRVGFFVGLCMAFTGIGGVIFNPIGTALINAGAEGWRTAYLVFGVVILVGTLPFTTLVVRSRPADKGLLPYGADEADESAPSATDGASPEPDDSMEASAAMRTSAFFALAAFSGLITLNQTIYQYLAGYAQSFAQTLPAVAAASGIVASAAMAGQAIGKVLLGVVNDRSVKLGAVMGIGAGVAGVTLMWLLPGQLALLLVGAFLFGIAYAETTVQTPLLVRTVFGSADYTNVYSCVSMVGSFMGTFAAVFWSLVVDSAGGYPLMFALGYVCMVGCLALALFSLHWKARRNAT